MPFEDEDWEMETLDLNEIEILSDAILAWCGIGCSEPFCIK